ncbi:MAG TPA: histidine kinase dimerization/phospho-acceptor domain-containing protein [Terracidiphilus sp.]|jgi:signal transduction histidine kinase|nr:histidine kinase dimerization/phospho-acceptor domain-containing protein [Terracidiphilus sp.]
MQDWYQMPALVLITLLLPAFTQLYLRNRDTRNLLWLLGFCLVAVRLFLVHPMATWDMVDTHHPWTTAAAQACAILASGLFLGSLSPLSFRVGKFKVLYVIPYILPLVVYALLGQGLYHGVEPAGILHCLFPGLAGISIVVGLFWGRDKGSLPPWIGIAVCLLFGGFAVWFYFRTGLTWPLILAESGNHFIVALLVISLFRRMSPGVFISVLGFLVWSLPILLMFPDFHSPWIHLLLLRCISLARVAAALGLILLTLENELAANQAARERERRARQELAAYAQLVIARRRVEDFDRQGDPICKAVAANSRFSQAALLLLHPSGVYRVAGAAGFDAAILSALDALIARIPVADFLAFSPPAVGGQTVRFDLHPWLKPGDDLERLRFTSALATPMQGRSVHEGALLLGGMRDAREPLRHDDLVPIEMLTARMQSVRSQTRMLEKLIDAEKFAGLGQLAGSVTQQLNNPLTVILGYAALLEETPRMNPTERKGVEAILSAARTMRSTLESLQRVAQAPSGLLTPVSVTEMLTDMERLHRSEFLQRAIEFRVTMATDLPQVRAQAQQLRQAVLHCLQFAMESVDHVHDESNRTVRLEATAEGDHVQILIAHSGPRFEDPDRAFDAFMPPHAGSEEAAGLGLSLCATILRENRGHASAVNLDPRGAAIVLELQAA